MGDGGAFPCREPKANICRKSSRGKERTLFPYLSQEALGHGGLSLKEKPGMPVLLKRKGPHTPDPGQGGVSPTVSVHRVRVTCPMQRWSRCQGMHTFGGNPLLMAAENVCLHPSSYGGRVPQTARCTHTGSLP